jgi:hypothetical protein
MLPAMRLLALVEPVGTHGPASHADSKPLSINSIASFLAGVQGRRLARGTTYRSGRPVKGLCIVACYLPLKSPWLNAIEPPASWIAHRTCARHRSARGGPRALDGGA